MKNELLGLIPEFKLIGDSTLLEKTLKVWEKSLRLGNWKVSDLERIPFTLMIPDTPISFKDHIRAVTRVCIKVAEAFSEVYGDKLKVNKDYLIAGALLHDIGKLMEYTEEKGKFIQSKSGAFLRHPFSGVGLCFEEGIPDEVLHIIAVHSKEGEGVRHSVEAIIVHYADFLNFDPFRL